MNSSLPKSIADQKSTLLHWLDSKRQDMLDTVIRWAAINSYSTNQAGLETITSEIQSAFSVLNAEQEIYPLVPLQRTHINGNMRIFELGKLLVFRKHPPQAKQKVLLGIHMDTVYPEMTPAVSPQLIDEHRLKGPGVADAKGGLVVMLHALQAFERDVDPKQIAWTVFINPDEELGSIGSHKYLQELAKTHDIGLLFEPSLPDGSLISERKGSAQYTLVARGRAAHAGRNPEKGRNAIMALYTCLDKLYRLHNTRQGLTVNIGRIHGGQSANMVPDFAMALVNVRVQESADQEYFDSQLLQSIDEVKQIAGITLELEQGGISPPKKSTLQTLSLLNTIRDCGKILDLKIKWRPSGGTCDGNKLAATGLPTVDSLGVRGDHIHSPDEYLFVDSLVERSKLLTLLLITLNASLAQE